MKCYFFFSFQEAVVSDPVLEEEESDLKEGGEPPPHDAWRWRDTTIAFKGDPEGPHWDPPTKPIPAGQAGGRPLGVVV
jgi:hypothetical protein